MWWLHSFFVVFSPISFQLVIWPVTNLLYQNAPTLDEEAQGALLDSSIVLDALADLDTLTN